MLNLNSTQRQVFDHAYGLALASGANTYTATAVASNAVINSFQNTPVVPKVGLDSFAFEFQKNGSEIIIQTDGAEEYVTAVLASNEHKWTNEELDRFVSSVNKDKPMGDIDHQSLKKMIDDGLTNNQIKERIKNKKGIVTAVKALVEDGKMYLRLAIDKRYKNVLKRAKGLSVEAMRSLGEVGSGEFLGFTVALNEDPAYSGATFLA